MNVFWSFHLFPSLDVVLVDENIAESTVLALLIKYRVNQEDYPRPLTDQVVLQNIVCHTCIRHPTTSTHEMLDTSPW